MLTLNFDCCAGDLEIKYYVQKLAKNDKILTNKEAHIPQN